MGNNCSICGNIYHNIVFRGGFICEDCRDYIKIVDTDDLRGPILPGEQMSEDEEEAKTKTAGRDAAGPE